MLATCLLMLLQPSQVMGQEKVSLIEPAKPHGGFVFNNGGEFPGAKGQAKVIETDAGKALELSGDLSGDMHIRVVGSLVLFQVTCFLAFVVALVATVPHRSHAIGVIRKPL
mgnify:CR=1 FL=1